MLNKFFKMVSYYLLSYYYPITRKILVQQTTIGTFQDKVNKTPP